MFEKFPKIPRFSRDIVISEKIDGTNAQIFIIHKDIDEYEYDDIVEITDNYNIYVGSRKRLITPNYDNFGFAKWVYDNVEKLIEILGPGRHFGEWWGKGIQRGYGLDHKRFSLFNTSKWSWLNDYRARQGRELGDLELHCVPELYKGPMEEAHIKGCLLDLYVQGSFAAPGYMNPEGIIIYHTAANVLFKKTIENDSTGKENHNEKK